MCLIGGYQSHYRRCFGSLFIHAPIQQDGLTSFFAINRCCSCRCWFPYQLMHQFDQEPKTCQNSKHDDHRNYRDNQTIT